MAAGVDAEGCPKARGFASEASSTISLRTATRCTACCNARVCASRSPKKKVLLLIPFDGAESARTRDREHPLKTLETWISSLTKSALESTLETWISSLTKSALESPPGPCRAQKQVHIAAVDATQMIDLRLSEQEAPVLLVQPDQVVTFRKNDATANIHLTNMATKGTLAVAIHATHAHFTANPHTAILPPGKRLQVELTAKAETLPERVIIRYSLLPRHISPPLISQHLADVREDWGASSKLAVHLLSCKWADASELQSEVGAIMRMMTSLDGDTSSLRARLVAVERLAILKSTQLLQAEERIAYLERRVGTSEPVANHAKLSTPPMISGGRYGPPVQFLSFVLVCLISAFIGAVHSDALIRFHV